jgi:hypothetical protein
MSHAQVEKGVPPVNGQEPRIPGQDNALDIIEPRNKDEQVPNNDVIDDATLNDFQGTGERPAYLGLRGDRLILGITLFATMGFSVSTPRTTARDRPEAHYTILRISCSGMTRV